MKLKSIFFASVGAIVLVVAVTQAFPSAENQPNAQSLVGGSNISPENTKDKKAGPLNPSANFATKRAIEAKQEMEILQSFSRIYARNAPEKKTETRNAAAAGNGKAEDAKEAVNPFENMDRKDVEQMVQYFPQIRSFLNAIHDKQEAKK